MAFSPEDWKESFKTSFGFIFQRPSLGILWPEDWTWRGGLGALEGKEGDQGSRYYPSFLLPQKNNLQRKENLRSAGRLGGASPSVR